MNEIEEDLSLIEDIFLDSFILRNKFRFLLLSSQNYNLYGAYIT